MPADYAKPKGTEQEPESPSTELNEDALQDVAGGTAITPLLDQINCHMPPPLYE